MPNMPPKITKPVNNVPDTRRVLDICEFGKQMQNFHKIQFEEQLEGDKRKFRQDFVEEIIEELHLAGLRKDQAFREQMINDIGVEPIQDYKYHKLIDFDDLEQFELERPASVSSISTSPTQTQPQNCTNISPSIKISQQTRQACKRRNHTPIDQQEQNLPAKILRPTSQDLEKLEFNVTRTDQQTKKSRKVTFSKNSIIQKAINNSNNF